MRRRRFFLPFCPAHSDSRRRGQRLQDRESAELRQFDSCNTSHFLARIEDWFRRHPRQVAQSSAGSALVALTGRTVPYKREIKMAPSTRPPHRRHRQGEQMARPSVHLPSHIHSIPAEQLTRRNCRRRLTERPRHWRRPTRHAAERCKHRQTKVSVPAHKGRAAFRWWERFGCDLDSPSRQPDPAASDQGPGIPTTIAPIVRLDDGRNHVFDETS